MGHQAGSHHPYQQLQRRLDRNVTGAPDSPVFTQILKLLFSPEEADVARQMPTNFISLNRLARRVDMPSDALDALLTAMGERGLVLDLERNGKRYFTLSPVVIGFFEYTFMRTRDDLPMAELARLFDQYFFQDERFARAVFAGETQVGRSLVREEALPDGSHVEILDWERASYLVESATSHAVSLCPCRHHHSHLGTACERPQRTCMSLNYGADVLVRNGLAEPLTTAQAVQLLAECKDAGLAQTADNVQRNVSYICNCCGCCCGMMTAIRTFNLRNAIVTSNWISDIDLEHCNGCGRCAKACPTGAIEIVIGEPQGRKRPRWAMRDPDLCLGCGVCYGACKHGAMRMVPREQRVFTPEGTFDRVITMAVERNKLAELILDNMDGWGYQGLGRIVQVLEKLPPYKAAMAVKPLRSAFLTALVGSTRRGTGPAREDL